MTSSQVFVGLSLILALAVVCQVVAARVRVPAIIVLLPAGFTAGALIPSVDPDKLLGVAFEPLVSLAVAVILFDGGLDLVLRELSGDLGVVVRRLLVLGIPITWAGAALSAGLLLGMSVQTAVMLGAILIVSGPTVVGPIMQAAAPGRRLDVILTHEGTTIDPIGALIGVVVYQILITNHAHSVARGLFGFAGRIAVGALGAAVGLAVLWLLLRKARLTGVLAAEAILATVLTTAGLCDALAPDTGLVAAIVMGMVIANVSGVDVPEDRRQLKTVVQLTIGLLFISISATVTPASLQGAILPSAALVALLVLVVRPVVAIVATWRTDLSLRERIFVGAMHPRGIIAASTAATFAPPLVALKLGGADKLLPATFLVIVGTAAVYGLGGAPLTQALRLGDPRTGSDPDPTPHDPSSS
jgi:NhaP-type Na+/H+ or K+/H+ antiporter